MIALISEAVAIFLDVTVHSATISASSCCCNRSKISSPCFLTRIHGGFNIVVMSSSILICTSDASVVRLSLGRIASVVNELGEYISQ